MSHVVVGIIIKKEPEAAYLLVRSKNDFGKYTGYYYPPAGHLEDGEDEISGLKRELKEELDLEINNTQKITNTDGDVPGQKTSWYICDCDNYNFIIDKTELTDADFFTEKEIANMNIWPATKKILDEYFFKK